MTQSDVKMAWGKVGDQLSALGLKLKLHAEQEFSEGHAEERADETVDETADVEAADVEAADGDDGGISDAVERLSEAIENVADAVGHAVTDKAVQHDVREAGRRLIDAIGITVNQATNQLNRKR